MDKGTERKYEKRNRGGDGRAAEQRHRGTGFASTCDDLSEMAAPAARKHRTLPCSGQPQGLGKAHPALCLRAAIGRPGVGSCSAGIDDGRGGIGAVQIIPNLAIIPVGAVIGILVAAPVGPVNVLCIQRAIERGFWGGVAAGLGAMLGDGLIALFASLGVGAISNLLDDYRTAIQIIGGLALIAFGLKLYFAAPRIEPARGPDAHPETLRDFVWDIPQTFFLTITNPGAVLGLFAIFGGVSSFVKVQGYVDALVMVASVMGGSLAWWVTLSHFIGRIRHRIDGAKLRKINRIAGVLLMLFGGWLIVEVLGRFVGFALG